MTSTDFGSGHRLQRISSWARKSSETSLSVELETRVTEAHRLECMLVNSDTAVLVEGARLV
jgi:hypothetical protein